MKKVIVAIDSFKGSLTSMQAARAVCRGVRSVYPECCVEWIEVADGGEGTAAALMASCGGRYVDVDVHGPLMRPLVARYAVLGDGHTACVETAAASGLSLLADELRDPLKTTSYGTGELIARAAADGCDHIIVGLGGSATCDAATGLMNALGWRFLDARGGEVTPCGGALESICCAENPFRPEFLDGVKLSLACDVDNPFCGRNGAARVFAPQKGADAEAVEILERGMAHFARVIECATGIDISDMSGAGAAGGIGGAMVAFMGAELCRGIDMVLDAADFDRMIAGADMVFTGEGRFDGQTLGGKVPWGVAQRATAVGVPTIVLAGEVAESLPERLSSAFDLICQITPERMPLAEAMRVDVAEGNMVRTVMQICRRWNAD